MIVLYIALGLLACGFLYPHVRCLCKRLVGAAKLHRACHLAGVRLFPAHPMWILGGKRGKACDFYIATKGEVLAVKLFGVPRRPSVLLFTEGGTWRIRRFVAHSAWWATVCIPIEGKPQPLPHYDFTHRLPREWSEMPLRRVLLIHPTAMELRWAPSHGSERILHDGEALHGMVVASLPHLLRLIAP